MKRSSSVPEMAPAPSSSPAGAAAAVVGGPVSLRSRRGMSSSQISLPGDLSRAPGQPTIMDTSSSPLSSWRTPLMSPIPLSRLNSPTSRPHRVEQLKKEECIDERQSEKEVMEINTLNQSYEELRVETGDLMEVWPGHSSPSHQPSFLSPSSPLTKLGSSARSRSLTPTSPLPNRTYCRRSCSPILRPSQLWTGQKRKREDSYNDVDMDTSPTTNYPAKRFQPSSAYRALSPTISPTLTPNTGNSPLHHSSRKSSSVSESTPLTSPSSLLAAANTLTVNPFAVGYDSGSCEHWHSSGSASSSGGQSPLLVRTARENGRSFEDSRKPHPPLEMKNNLQIETTGLSDSHHDTPSPLSPKGLQFRHRPFLSSSSLQSPIPRSPNLTVATPTSSRSPRPPTASLLQHDKQLSPFNSDLGTYPPSSSHRQLHRLRGHISGSSLTVPVSLLRSQPKPPELAAVVEPLKPRLYSPLSKLSVSTSVDEYHVPQRKRRNNSDMCLDRDESMMESDSGDPGEGLDVTAAKRT